MGYNPSDMLQCDGQYPIMSERIEPEWKKRFRQLVADDGRGMKAISLEAGVGETYVRDILERDKSPSLDKMIDLARVLKASISELTDELPPSANSVAIMGYIGAGAAISPDMEQVPGDGLESVELPFPIPEETWGFQIVGTSMLPKYGDGDVIVVWREQRRPLDAFYGVEAAVRTEDGKRFLKRIARGAKKNVVNLESFNADTIQNVRLEWIGEICVTVPQSQIRRIDAAHRASQAKKAKQRALADTQELPLKRAR